MLTMYLIAILYNHLLVRYTTIKLLRVSVFVSHIGSYTSISFSENIEKWLYNRFYKLDIHYGVSYL